jgi:CelD/BcsL family acetyltransferase involved in cellulose biosynthesis
MSFQDINIQVLEGFDDPRCGPAVWNALVTRGGTDAIFLTWEWQKAWWESFERTGLLLLGAERDGELLALAPFFAEEGMIYFVGSGGSDYLDFIGEIGAPEVLDGLLRRARESVPDFIGFRFFHLPDKSPSAELLRNVACRLGLALHEEGLQHAPAVQFGVDESADRALTQKKSLLRHEAYFRRSASLEVLHHSTAEEIEPHLDGFFQQHIGRWGGTPHPSLFHDARQQRFYRAVTCYAAPAGWLRFTRVESDGRAIAFHFGFAYHGAFMWYKPTFAIELARHSPGEVLLRQLLLRAIEERAHTFDFGLGDEPFKHRFANHAQTVRDFGLYPATAPASAD